MEVLISGPATMMSVQRLKLQFCLRLDERIGIFYLIQTIKVTDSSRDGKQKLVSHWIITLYRQKEVMK
jgi:hypothetical protein